MHVIHRLSFNPVMREYNHIVIHTENIHTMQYLTMRTSFWPSFDQASFFPLLWDLLSIVPLNENTLIKSILYMKYNYKTVSTTFC